MTLSNTRLTPEQKAARKYMLEKLPAGSQFGYNKGSGLTILMVPRGCVVEVFSSLASVNEQKFRPEVGEYHALLRSGCGGFILPAGYWTAQELADTL